MTQLQSAVGSLTKQIGNLRPGGHARRLINSDQEREFETSLRGGTTKFKIRIYAFVGDTESWRLAMRFTGMLHSVGVDVGDSPTWTTVLDEGIWLRVPNAFLTTKPHWTKVKSPGEQETEDALRAAHIEFRILLDDNMKAGDSIALYAGFSPQQD